jgi:hypothetical protein
MWCYLTLRHAVMYLPRHTKDKIKFYFEILIPHLALCNPIVINQNLLLQYNNHVITTDLETDTEVNH